VFPDSKTNRKPFCLTIYIIYQTKKTVFYSAEINSGFKIGG